MATAQRVTHPPVVVPPDKIVLTLTVEEAERLITLTGFGIACEDNLTSVYYALYHQARVRIPDRLRNKKIEVRADGQGWKWVD